MLKKGRKHPRFATGRECWDLSKVFHLPTIPQDIPRAEQPPGMNLPLFDYQLRSLFLMQRLEKNGVIPRQSIGLKEVGNKGPLRVKGGA
jgi:hypothetical protein